MKKNLFIIMFFMIFVIALGANAIESTVFYEGFTDNDFVYPDVSDLNWSINDGNFIGSSYVTVQNQEISMDYQYDVNGGTARRLRADSGHNVTLEHYIIKFAFNGTYVDNSGGSWNPGLYIYDGENESTESIDFSFNYRRIGNDDLFDMQLLLSDSVVLSDLNNAEDAYGGMFNMSTHKYFVIEVDGDSGFYNMTVYKDSFEGVSIYSSQGTGLGFGTRQSWPSEIPLKFNLDPGTAGAGDEFKATLDEIEVLEVNVAPTTDTSGIIPSVVYHTDNMEANCTGSDGESDPLTFSFKWYENSTTVVSTAGNYTAGTQGTTYTLECTANDGYQDGTALNSSVLTVSNTVPVASNVSILQTTLYTYTNANCTYVYSDLDGDPEEPRNSPSGTNIKWFKNGVEISGEDDVELNSSLFDTYDLIRCEVEPSDGDYGTAVNSSELNISNNAAEFDETVTGFVLNIIGGIPEEISYTSTWTDDDSHNLTSITSSCAFLSVSKTGSDGSGTWSIDYTASGSQEGVNSCNVTINDGYEDTVSNQFNVEVYTLAGGSVRQLSSGGGGTVEEEQPPVEEIVEEPFSLTAWFDEQLSDDTIIDLRSERASITGFSIVKESPGAKVLDPKDILNDIVFYILGIILALVMVAVHFPGFAHQKRKKLVALLAAMLIFSVFMVMAFNLNVWLSLISTTVVSGGLIFMLFARQATKMRAVFARNHMFLILIEVGLFVANLFNIGLLG